MFVMCLSQGYGDEASTSVIATYDSVKDAQWEVNHRNRKIDHINGRLAAVEIIMGEWLKSHPEPSHGCAARSKAWDDWRTLEGEEKVRLEQLFDIDALCEQAKLSRYYIDSANFYFQEVPHNPGV